MRDEGPNSQTRYLKESPTVYGIKGSGGGKSSRRFGVGDTKERRKRKCLPQGSK